MKFIDCKSILNFWDLKDAFHFPHEKVVFLFDLKISKKVCIAGYEYLQKLIAENNTDKKIQFISFHYTNDAEIYLQKLALHYPYYSFGEKIWATSYVHTYLKNNIVNFTELINKHHTFEKRIYGNIEDDAVTVISNRLNEKRKNIIEYMTQCNDMDAQTLDLLRSKNIDQKFISHIRSKRELKRRELMYKNSTSDERTKILSKFVTSELLKYIKNGVEKNEEKSKIAIKKNQSKRNRTKRNQTFLLDR